MVGDSIWGGLIFDLEQRNSILRTGRLDLMGEGRLGERCEVKRREGAQDPDEEETPKISKVWSLELSF